MSRIRIVTVMLGIAALLAPAPANADHAGWWNLTSTYTSGVRGYIHQSDPGTVNNGIWTANIQQNNRLGVAWLEVGTYMGYFGIYGSPFTPFMYSINGDGCGHITRKIFDLPPTDNYFYQIRRNTDRVGSVTCDGGYRDGEVIPKYSFNVRLGSPGGDVAWTGWIDHPDGEAWAENSIQTTSTTAKARFGCDTTACGSSTYGLELFDGSWSLWDNSFPGSDFEDTPPYLDTVVTKWAFKTCETAC